MLKNMLYAEERPWGKFIVLQEGKEYKVKCIEINPEASLSLQYHNFRFEDWVIVEGEGIIQNGDDIKTCVVGDRIHIEPKSIHRATAGKNGLKFIEVQRGSCDESDIIRLEDTYGRVA
jgi:mannose-6-phosphate isomerase-like protein (cupin superfamily)